jgi:lambda repressor-like predicted transcriptional regulator
MSIALFSQDINKTVRVIGKIMPRYNSIMAESIEVFEKGAWEERWSAKKEYEQKTFVWPKT